MNARVLANVERVQVKAEGLYLANQRVEQLRGQAGKRQVKVRAETALAAFTTPPNGGWMMFGKHPS